MTVGAVRPSMRSAATTVSVFQWPCGTSRNEALAARGTPVVTDHLRRHRRLIDEHEARRTELGLLGLQLRARGRDVRTILLGGVQSFFLTVMS